MPNLSRSWHELRSGFYDNLPKSLKGPALVRTKVERPEIQHVRSQIVYSMTPSQLSKIESWTDLPLPRLRKKPSRYVLHSHQCLYSFINGYCVPLISPLFEFDVII